MIKKDHSTKVSRLSSMIAWYALICAIWLPIAPSALARAESARFEIASQPLPAALQAFAEQAHMQLLYEHVVVAGATSNAISGELDKRAALEQLLRGTGLEIIYSYNNAASIRLARTNPDNLTKEQREKQREKSIESNIGPTQLNPHSLRNK